MYVVTGGMTRGKTSIDGASSLGYRHALLSYVRAKKVDQVFHAARRFDGILLDSGAFSVLNTGQAVNLDRYIAYCKVVGGIVDCYANLDVIGDPVGTAQNQRRMEAAGLLPMPTFHTGGPLDVLRAMCDDYKHIALSGTASMKGSARIHNLDLAWRVVREHKNWPIKVHGWAMTDPILMERYPWWSVDSTTWAVGVNYGSALVLRGRIPVQRARASLPLQLQDPGPVGTRLRLRKTAESLQTFVEHITDVWAARGVAWQEDKANGHA